MKHALDWGLALALVGLGGCPGDDGTPPVGGSTSTGSATTSTGPGGTSTGVGSSSSGNGGGTSTGMADGSSTTAAGSSSGGGPLCDPPVIGEWNSCLDEQGQIDNTLCNWMGNPDNNGFITCLSGADPDGGNVCTIRGCEDVCDCFEPPATGTAEVVCAEIIAGGELGCGLDCGDGQTCPDGMQCTSGLCFWPDPG